MGKGCDAGGTCVKSLTRTRDAVPLVPEPPARGPQSADRGTSYDDMMT